jgi:hypothetical protein
LNGYRIEPQPFIGRNRHMIMTTITQFENHLAEQVKLVTEIVPIMSGIAIKATSEPSVKIGEYVVSTAWSLGRGNDSGVCSIACS